jgi:chromosome segregation ATPase
VTDTSASASEGLAELAARRDEARGRVDQLEADLRASTIAREQSRARLVEFERVGGSPPERRKLEKELRDCEARCAEPWGVRIDGARARVRDLDGEIRVYASANLGALIAEVEAEGAAIVARLNAAAGEFLEASHARAAVEQRLFTLLAAAGRQNHPSDVNRSRADAAVAALSDLVRAGGELEPRVQVAHLRAEVAA